MQPKVLLVVPPYHAGVVESAGVWMPLGLAYLATAARAAGAEVQIYDAMSRYHELPDVARTIESYRPDVVGVSAITATEGVARAVCRAAKDVNPATLTVLGNVHPSFCHEQVLADPSVDVLVRGEGELTFAELVQVVAAGVRPDALGPLERVPGLAFRRHGLPVRTAARPFVPDLDALEAAWDLVEWPLYFYRPSPEGRFAIVSSSRGCRQRCTFCSQQKMWERTWRARSPEAFVAELERLRDRHDVHVAMLADETPTVDRPRWERVLDLLIERRVGVELLMETRVDDILRDEALLPRYREAGISHIYIGVEATSQETLDLFKKDVKVAESKRAIDLINAADIITETSFVLGMPDDTPESIRATGELARWYAPDMAFFLALAPWPYADIYPDLEPYIAVRDYSRYNLVEPVVKPRAMTLEEMSAALHRTTGEFFHDKFRRLAELSPAKQTYMVAVLKLLIEHSYLGHEMHAMASGARMPPEVKAMLETLGVALPGRGAASG